MTTFEDYDINESLLRGIYGYGFVSPSTTQEKGFKPVLKGNDLLLQAPSGTGKTGAFCIPVLERINPNNKKAQVLILSPTRDIALQHCNLLNELSSYMDNVNIIECIGGQSKSYDMQREIKNGGQIICGTVGRVKDMIQRRAFDIRDIEIVVFDEADVLLEKSFRDDIMYDIMANANSDVQVCLYSATLPDETLEFACQKLLRADAEKILLNKDNLTLDGIKQYYIPLEDEGYKIDVIEDLYNFLEVSQSLIFVNSKHKAMELEEELHKRNYTLSVITGDMTQEDRNGILSEFRAGKSRIMICSDLIARGIDIKGIKLVINFDFPNNRENYIHRIGRSGRFGSKGVAINLVTDKEVQLMKEVEEFYHTQIEELPSDIENLI